MAGRAGEIVAGVIGLAGVFMASTGLVLWWPARRRFALAYLWPRGFSRRDLLRWHRDLGVALSPLILLLLLTGCGLVWYGTAQTILNGLFGDNVPAAGTPTRTAEVAPGPPDASMLARVEAAFPDARLVFYYPPQDGEGIIRFRLTASQRPLLGLCGRRIRPGRPEAGCLRHAAGRARHQRHLSPPCRRAIYKLAVFLGAVALAVLSLTGVIAYVGKLRGKLRPNDRSLVAGGQPEP